MKSDSAFVIRIREHINEQTSNTTAPQPIAWPPDLMMGADGIHAEFADSSHYCSSVGWIQMRWEGMHRKLGCGDGWGWDGVGWGRYKPPDTRGTRARRFELAPRISNDSDHRFPSMMDAVVVAEQVYLIADLGPCRESIASRLLANLE